MVNRLLSGLTLQDRQVLAKMRHLSLQSEERKLSESGECY